MYLKSLEIVGFKSFADRTKLEFEPGMTAIVGPNGCGKSNIADAIRWVLGEKSAKALRGVKMEDCIFNGTDERKALGLAQVSLTLSDCEDALSTEFNEVTVSRRVHRSGDSQYFINNAACRLKDIQRLFMDTGIGSTSYSLMEQGRIDRILSSRPSDRREVFEEASGITKFKADKKEAIRKLEHTEANLLRLADIIREVKRQIISLQRQAGKARRYKSLHGNLRSLDTFITKTRLEEISQDIDALSKQLTDISNQDNVLSEEMAQIEQKATETRQALALIESNLANVMDACVQAQTDLDRTKQILQINSDRIKEYENLAARDSRDVESALERNQTHKEALEKLNIGLKEAENTEGSAKKEVDKINEELIQFNQQKNKIISEVNASRNDSISQERQQAKLQNELSDLDAHEQANVIRRERLLAEQQNLQRTIEIYQERQDKMADRLQNLKDEVTRKEQFSKELSATKNEQATQQQVLEKALAELRTQLAARKAEFELLSREDAQTEQFPGGARLLLDKDVDPTLDRRAIIGSLADQIEAQPDYRIAVEAVLRTWLDAIVIQDTKGASDLLNILSEQKKGSARLLINNIDFPVSQYEGSGESLIPFVKCEEVVEPLLKRLLANVRLVETIDDIPSPIPPNMVFVNKEGCLISGVGAAEFWMTDVDESNPLTRRHQLAAREKECEELQEKIDLHIEELKQIQEKGQSAQQRLNEARIALETSRRDLAQCNGENQVISSESKQTKERAETIAWEIKSLTSSDEDSSKRSLIKSKIEALQKLQSEIQASIKSKTIQLEDFERDHATLTSRLTEARIQLAERRQQTKHLISRQEPLKAQIAGLESLISDRNKGLSTYTDRINQLKQSIVEATDKVEPLENKVSEFREQLGAARHKREEHTKSLTSISDIINTKRSKLDLLRSKKMELEVKLAEQRMRSDNILERIASEHHLTAEQLASEPEPDWGDEEKPDPETLETMIAEIRTKLDSMGPVNLIAIEEHKDLEERYSFLTQQQDDLVKAKQQLLDMIKHINKTTTEMFSTTFEEVNKNFQTMFKQLFGGGSAKLVLIDDEDVLESGIEIIARPPGKKLQSISLLSGGERTLTAVALLFGLYLVKPSPFCVLDELDAALDDTNIGRFVKTVQGFLEKSQFIIITHSRQTISASDILYGITMEKSGVSKIVSVRFSDHEDENDDNENIPEEDNNHNSTQE